jgi:hypothetical protein
VKLLWQVEVAVASGKTAVQGSNEASITEQTCYRWRKEFGHCRFNSLTMRSMQGSSLQLKRGGFEAEGN